MSSTIALEQIERVVRNQHHNPFEVLGPHSIDRDGTQVWVVRAYLPNADMAWVVRPETRKEYPMTNEQHPQFFEAVIDEAITDDEGIANYQIRYKSGGSEHVAYDPYAFKSPVITGFDEHLFAEGNHHRIYEKMGAHPMTQAGIAGVYFALWAPNARNVSVIGDFNSWDGRQHQMRKGNSGIWDLFIPQLKVGDTYKYEVKNNDGHIYEKSDPYGFEREVRPDTASIVADLDSYEWNDQAWMEHRRQSDPMVQPIAVYEVHLGSWMHESSAQPAKQADGSDAPVVTVADLKPGARFLT
ncbi:MAG: 1,4-alpha-glucan branching enzyme, partial [Cyanobacteria bacterium P01_D01_bin.1]